MLIQANNLSYSVSGKLVLDNLNLQIKEDGIAAILGSNGTGKSTLLSIIAGLTQPEAGEVHFQNEKVLGPDLKLVPGHPGITLVRQDMKLTPYATIRENLTYILTAWDNNEQEVKIEELSKL